jgi:N-acetylmuramoyl-L-alanine amidase
MSPTRIVLHYTAGSSLSGAIETLRDRGLSYNVLIDKDGSVHQARAFDRSAGHAGRSNWKASSGLTNASSLNTSSIGISMVNVGLHDFFRGGRWWYGFRNGDGVPPSVADEDANKLSSIYVPNRRPHWDPYPEVQVAACHEVVREIVNHYPEIEEIVGHDDIAIDDKFDPGPALPTQTWREEFGKEGPLGLRATVNSPDEELNMRDRPVHHGGAVIAVLNQGDEVHIRSVTYASAGSVATLVRPQSGRALTGWASVDTNRSNKHAGFVHMRYLSANPLAAEYAAAL